MVILELLVCIIVYLMPLFVGFAMNHKSISEAYLFGQVAIWAGFQLVAVPMILLRAHFMTLVVFFSLLVLIFAVYGGYKFKECIRNLSIIDALKIDFNLFLIPAIALIAIQLFFYVFGQHLDEDDARWLGEANDALVHNRMLLHNPLTGEYIGHPEGEMVKDVFSPWCMFLAYLSKVTFLSPAVTSHMVYAPILLILAYLVYYRIGKNLFRGRLEQGGFLLFIALIMFLETGNYTQARFSLVRIWQGKATVAAVMIPLFLLCLLEIENKNRISDWIMLAISSTAGCLFSGMGIAISFILVGAYGAYAVLFNRLNRIPFYLLSICQPVVFGLMYYFIYKI